MNIIILGAGQVGTSLTENLVREDHDITVIDSCQERLSELQDIVDIRTIRGSGSYPDILIQGGASSADMLIAVTGNDETNMVACQMAYHLFHTPTKIARIRSPHYLKYEFLFQSDAIPIDVCIYPEQLITNHIYHLIEYPGTTQVLDFAEGRAQLVTIRAEEKGPLIGKSLEELDRNLSEVEGGLAAVYRGHLSIPISHDHSIRAGDELMFLTARDNVHALLKKLGRLDKPYRKIMIAGGGHVGGRLAKFLEPQCQVKIIESNPQKAKELADTLKNSTVFNHDACDRNLLMDENVDQVDVFCSLTNDDEDNILSSMLAKKLGARHVITLINRLAYVDLIQGSVIDIAVNPQQITMGKILTYIRHGDISNVYTLRRGAAEAIEIVVHGDTTTSKVVGRQIKNIQLPPGTHIGAIVRDDRVIIPKKDHIIEQNDHVILFLIDKKFIKDVARLFQVKVAFFS